MSIDAYYADALQAGGFIAIAGVHYRVSVTAWWHPQERVQVLLLPIGDAVLIKADKSYYLQSVSEAGETWTRDIPALHDWLEAHLPEVRIAFSHFRDVPEGLASKEARRLVAARSPQEELPTTEHLATLQQRVRKTQASLSRDSVLSAMFQPAHDTLSQYLYHRHQRNEAAALELQERRHRQREQHDLHQHLQREYLRKGSAAVYTLSIHSNLQLSTTADEFGAALRAVRREIQDQHRYHVQQKLSGGRLNIQIVEADQPEIAWIEQWLGGTLSPTQLARIEQAVGTPALPQDHVMVVADEPITAPDGAIQSAAKHLGARVLSNVISRLDKTETSNWDVSNVDEGAEPLRIGSLLDASDRALGPAELPVNQIVHALISGTTGSGKSYLARVLVEEAAMVEGLGVLVLDPRNQFAGLLVPEDRQPILSRYAGFGMDVAQARGFGFAYHAPAIPEAPLPQDVNSLATGQSIVSLKGLDEKDRCDRAATILNTIFTTLANRGEADHPRLLIVMDEAHLFTRKRLTDAKAIEVAARSEAAIDLIVREGRKYGIVLILVSQSMKDFSRDLASVRQMTNTKIFLRNADNEIDYADDVLGEGRALVNLPTGVALIHNAAWGVRRVRMRPPFSKVCELNEDQLRNLIVQPALRSEQTASAAARSLLAAVRERCRVSGPVNMTQAAQLGGITSKRRLQALVGELERAGLLSSLRLAERGSPRLMTPTDCRSLN